MIQTTTPAERSSAPPIFSASAGASLAQLAVFNSLSRLNRGRLRVELADGTVQTFGQRKTDDLSLLPLGISPSAVMRIHRPAFFRKCILAGDIGFAESFVDGDWTSPDPTAVVAWFIQNIEAAPGLSGSRRASALSLNILRAFNRLTHVLRPNSAQQARRNVSEHYDLSNDFFALFLDRSLMYSSGKWSSPDATLEAAQREKNDALCRNLRLTSSDHVLEIGGGWGGWSVYAAKTYGCRITTVTVSQQQFAFARRQVEEAGLAGRIDVRLQDYRELSGQFDKLVSIEMLEAVGHAYHSIYFQTCARLLKPAGLIALQFITCPDARYDQFRKGVDFIQKHIFPGSLLLSLNRVNDLLSQHGGFVLHRMEDLGHDYARTLRLWRAEFRRQLPQVRQLGFDDRFIRKWDYYLCYCEAAFAMRNISVVQTLHTRPNNLAL